MYLPKSALLLSISFFSLLSSSSPVQPSAQITYFNNNAIFQSPPSYTVPGTLYARTIQLPDHSLLATWENYSPEPPPVYFPIYRSADYGLTWTHLSNVTDQSYGWGNRYQPFLYLLHTPFAKWPAGTVLLVGSSIPTDLSSTHLELYASTDSGLTWEFISHIAAGGEAVPNNGQTPVWEPYLLLHNNKLIAYYSDQRDPAHGQKLVHQTTTDGYTWGEVVDDAAYANYTSRPGMPVVAQMGTGGEGKFIMTYEYGGGPVNGVLPANYNFPIFYKVSDDPEAFGSVEGLPIVTAQGVVPVSSSYVVWDESVGLIVSCGTRGDVFVNKGVDVGGWESRATGERVSYTRSLRMIIDEVGGKGLSLSGGGSLPPSQGNMVTIGVVDVGGW